MNTAESRVPVATVTFCAFLTANATLVESISVPVASPVQSLGKTVAPGVSAVAHRRIACEGLANHPIESITARSSECRINFVRNILVIVLATAQLVVATLRLHSKRLLPSTFGSRL